MKKSVAILLAVAGLLLLSTPLLAERVYTASASVDLVGGVDDNPQVSGLNFDRLTDDFSMTWGLYPKLILNSTGSNSEFELFYNFGMNRVDSELDLDSESHAFGGSLRADTRKFSIKLAEAFRRSPDFTGFNVFQGVVFTPEGLFFDYETVALRRNSYENTSSVDLGYKIGAQSTLHFGGGQSLRDYETDPLFARRLADQNRLNGNVRYERSVTQRTSWDIGYAFSYFDFRNVYDNARNHGANLGIRHQFSPSVEMRLSGGPSYLERLGTSAGDTRALGYEANLNVSKSFENELINLFYRRRHGGSSGIGSLSETHQVGFGLIHPFGRRTVLNLGLSFYRTDPLFDNPYKHEGLLASLVLNFNLTDHWAVNVGGSYRSQDEKGDIDAGYGNLDRRRVFVSLRFMLPEFWRSRR